MHPRHQQFLAYAVHIDGLNNISVLTTCTFMFRQVCIIELSFFKRTSGMHRRSFEGRHLVLYFVFIRRNIPLCWLFLVSSVRKKCNCSAISGHFYDTSRIWNVFVWQGVNCFCISLFLSFPCKNPSIWKNIRCEYCRLILMFDVSCDK